MTLDLDLDSARVDWVLADAQRLKQVLLNLVGNAIKFTERGLVSLARRVPRERRSAARWSASRCATPASAFRKASIGDLFQPFHQVVGTQNRRPDGTGLGLAISQRIVEAMGSQIEVESAARDRGRCSGSDRRWRSIRRSCRLPSRIPLMGGLDDERTLSGTVLVVEDNDVNRMIAREVLQSLGVDVIEAGDGQEALERSRRTRRRPGSDGLPDAGDGRLRGDHGDSRQGGKHSGRRACRSSL